MSGYEKVVDVLKHNNTFMICSHSHPDGDGIGSTLALGVALERMGKKVEMYNEDSVPRSIDFLPAVEKMLTSLENDSRYDVTIMVDCNQPARAGKDFPSKDRRGILVCIDHHAKGCKDADVSCLDEAASSTGEVVYKILGRMGVAVDQDIATHILTTIIVDTGFFRYSNTTSHALELAAELVGKGASTWNISKMMEERVPREQLNLLSAAIETIDYHLNGDLAIMLLTGQMMREANANVEMAEDFINFPRSIDGIKVAAFIREIGRNHYKISLRSKDSINVAALASKFGGGGHAQAAGFSLNDKIGIVKQMLIEEVAKALHGSTGSP